MRSDVADFDPNCPMLQARLHASEMLASRGVYGLVWLDEELVVRRRYGRVVDFIEIDAPITQSVLPIFGLEQDIKALKAAPDSMLRLPNVAIVGPAGASPRLTMLIYAFKAPEPYVMIVAPIAAGTTLEVELSRQMRARLIAEAEATAKSRELARANAELTVANDNLEQFAAIVTHDLKAPMRAVRYLVDEIEAAVGASEADVARGKLGELRRQTARLSSMLAALLHYSNSGSSPEAIERVDTLALVSEIVRSLPLGGIDVTIGGHWPTVDTLAAPLDLTLRNLIGNTLKHHDRHHGRLELSCADAGSTLEITVADDGPGIAPEHHASVFLPFRTLGDTGEGMGLAIVQKMVDAAGGSITLCSDPAERRGAIFKVRWPK